MNSTILRHLGVALLGHYNLIAYVPRGMFPTYEAYQLDKKAFPDLVKNAELKAFITDKEFIIEDTNAGRASLLALAMMFGEIPLTNDHSHVTDKIKSDALFNRMRGKVRLRKL